MKRPYFGWLVVQNRGHSGSRYVLFVKFWRKVQMDQEWKLVCGVMFLRLIGLPLLSFGLGNVR